MKSIVLKKDVNFHLQNKYKLNYTKNSPKNKKFTIQIITKKGRNNYARNPLYQYS